MAAVERYESSVERFVGRRLTRRRNRSSPVLGTQTDEWLIAEMTPVRDAAVRMNGRLVVWGGA
jgi:hypothetical protein